MSTFREKISKFSFHEETPVEEVLGEHPMEEVFTELDLRLNGALPESEEVIAATLFFLRDAALYEHPRKMEFRDFLSESVIWKTFEKLLKAPVFRVRAGIISTIGKVYQPDKANLLAEIFSHYLQHDPINASHLLAELGWLEGAFPKTFWEQMHASSHYLTRWSCCEFAVGKEEGEAGALVLPVLLRLKNDVHPLLAAEAAYLYERVKIKQAAKLSKLEWRKEVERIEALTPKHTFGKTAREFMRDRVDYTVAEFDAHVSKLI